MKGTVCLKSWCLLPIHHDNINCFLGQWFNNEKCFCLLVVVFIFFLITEVISVALVFWR